LVLELMLLLACLKKIKIRINVDSIIVKDIFIFHSIIQYYNL